MNKEMGSLKTTDGVYCQYCGEPATYGDERNMWIGYHGAWYHRLYWNIKNKLMARSSK